MSTLFKSFLSLFLIFICVSCEAPAEPLPQPDEPEVVNVGIALSQINEQETTDLIAVQVYQYVSDVKNVYAYGLFDTYAFPQLELVNNTQYSISVTTVEDGQNIIAHELTNNGKEFYKPFSHYATTPLQVTNSFQVSKNYFQYLSQGVASIISGKSSKDYKHPIIKRYVGYSDKFIPTENQSIAISLKRVYGAFKLTASDLNDGRLVFSFSDAPDVELTPSEPSKTVYMSLSGSMSNEESWIEDDYFEPLAYSISYISSSDVTTPFGDDLKVNLVRNKTQPISVTVLQNSGIQLTVEDGEMEELGEIVL